MDFPFAKIIAKKNAITRSFLNIDSIVDENIKRLFLLLILTSLTTLFLGNIFVMNMGVLKASGILWFVCFSIYLSLYGLTVLTGSFQFSLVLNVLLLVLLVRTQFYELRIFLYMLSLYGGYVFIRDISRDHINWYACLLLSGLGTLTIFGSYFYTNFDMLDRLYAGVVNQDTLYHASISSMIKTYGVVSTGINGLVETPYHVLSHTIIAAMSKISGVSVIESYGFIPYLFFGPLLIMVLVKSVPNLKEDMSLNISWFIACIALILLPQLLADWKVRTYHFTSESYMVSLVFLLSALPLLVQKKITTFNLILIVLLGGLAAHAKASVGLLVFCLFCARLIFISEPSLRIKEMIFAVIFAIIIYFTLSRSANSVANSGYISFQPFVFLLKYAGGKGYDDIIQNLNNGFSFNAVLEFLKLIFVVLVFIFMHFLVSWSVVIWAYIKGGLKFMLDQPWVIYSISAFLFGLGFLSLFNLGPAGYYFSNISMFVSLPILISIVAFYFPQNWQKFIFPVMLIIVLAQSMSGIRPKTIRYHPSKTADHSLITAILKMRNTLGDNIIMRYPDQLNLRSRLGMKNCLAQPFFFPAISERSWLGAIDEKGCHYKFFNYSNYLNVDLLGKEKRYNKSHIPSNMKIIDYKKQ